MNILVLVKEVPDMDNVKFDSDKGTVDRSSAKAEINPFDESALQAAIDLREQYGGKVTVVTMGPGKAVKSLQEAYARGANDGVLVTDRAFGGSDTVATARTLSEAIKTIEYDLILCGEKSVDGDTAQVGAEVAEFLQIPHCYYADHISLENGKVKVSIENLCGKRQIRLMSMPALVGVTKNIAKLKLPTVNRKLESMDMSFTTLGLEDLVGLSKENTGFNGSPTKVARIEVPKEMERKSVIYKGDFDGFVGNLDKEVRNRGIVR